MKKILLYTDTPYSGGAELQIYLLAKFLNKLEFKPILACSNFQALDKWVEKFEKIGVDTIRFNVIHKHDPRHYFALKKAIRDYDINMIHAHVWNPASCRYAYKAAKTLKIPLITTEHDPFKLGALKHFFKNRNLKVPKKIITVSEKNANLLKEIHPKYQNKITTIHCGIDITWWQSQLLGFKETDRTAIKETLFHANKDSLIITNVAELHERKNQKMLIEVAYELVKKYSNIKIVFVGKGKELQNLQKLSKNLGLERHIIFTGYQSEIPKILKSSDIFCLTSKREAFGLVNTEAMICGLPSVSTAVGGIPEVIKEGETGFVVQNKTTLYKRLSQLIESSQLRKELGENGIKRVINEFSAKKMAEKHEQLYKNILDGEFMLT